MRWRRPVPAEGVAPTNLPKDAAPPGTISPLPIPATPDASQRPLSTPPPPSTSAGVRPDGVQAASFHPTIPPPVGFANPRPAGGQ